MILYTMSKPIEIDNEEKLEQYKDHAPSASYISGMLDGDGCIFIRKITDGFQSGITLAQSRTNVLQILRYHFGGSITSSENRNCNTVDKITEDGYFDKHAQRNEYNLFIRSNEYSIILEYIKNHIIIKQKQFDALYEFSKLVHVPGKNIEKDLLYTACSKKREIFDYNFSRLNVEYIQQNKADFYRFFNEADRRHGTDFLKTFPEMTAWWAECEYHARQS